MSYQCRPKRLITAVIGAAVAAVGPVFAADPGMQASSDMESLKAHITQLEKQDEAMRIRIADLEQRADQNWLTQERTAQIKAIAQDVLADARTRGQLASNGWEIGYDNGFFLKKGDEFKLQANALVDFRYTYARAENVNANPKTPLGSSYAGDMSGFSLNNAQIALSGNIFRDVIFKAMGNFGSNTSYIAPSAGTFQVNELWAGYRFSPELSVRGGSLIIPLIPIKTLANYGGSQFPDPAVTSVPFAPGYGLGVDVYGTLANQTVSYDVMLGNGSNSQNLVDSAVPAGGRDNRLSIYTREQYVGSGKLSDFMEEPDLQNHQTFVWIAGGGVGYESRNSNASAFPSPQTTTAIGGLSTDPSPGFLPSKYTLDGNLYRSALDFRTKYQGWSTYTELLYQQINGNSVVIPHLATNSVGQFGYFVQTGYFLIPKKFEVAARFGQLLTVDLPNRMDVYTLGLNYYLFGENAKVQFAETYIPNEAGLTDSNGAIVNTQDYITELQFQLKW
jgi:hypothetical protein